MIWFDDDLMTSKAFSFVTIHYEKDSKLKELQSLWCTFPFQSYGIRGCKTAKTKYADKSTKKYNNI